MICGAALCDPDAPLLSVACGISCSAGANLGCFDGNVRAVCNNTGDGYEVVECLSFQLCVNGQCLLRDSDVYYAYTEDTLVRSPITFTSVTDVNNSTIPLFGWTQHVSLQLGSDVFGFFGVAGNTPFSWHDLGQTHRDNLALSASEDGSFVFSVWEDYNTSDFKLYAAWHSANGEPIGDAFLVETSLNGFAGPQAQALDPGHAVVVWADAASASTTIRAKIYPTSLGVGIPIDIATAPIGSTTTRVAPWGDNNSFVTAWVRNDYPPVSKFACYNPDGTRVGDEQALAGNLVQLGPRIDNQHTAVIVSNTQLTNTLFYVINSECSLAASALLSDDNMALDFASIQKGDSEFAVAYLKRTPTDEGIFARRFVVDTTTSELITTRGATIRVSEAGDLGRRDPLIVPKNDTWDIFWNESINHAIVHKTVKLP